MKLNGRHLLALVALAILAALIALLLIRPPAAAPTADGDPTSTEPIQDAAGIPEVDPLPWAAVAWQSLEDPLPADQPPIMRMDAMVNGGDLIIGWGRASTPNRNQFNDMGAVFVSRDGRSWQTALIEHGVNEMSTSELHGVAVGPRGYLAYGGVCCEPETRALWHSTDGLGWTRLEIEGDLDLTGVYLAAVVGVESGWVAIGNTINEQEGQLWTSEDGSDWKLIDGDQAGLASATLSDLAIGPDGLVAVGTVDGQDGTYDGGIWTSADGRSWQRVGDDDQILAGEGETQLHAVVAHAGGLFITGVYGSTQDRQKCEQLGVATAHSDPPRTALSCASGTEHHWVLREGHAWERIDPMQAPGEHPIEFRVVVAGGPGLIVLGESSPPASPDTALFSSSDGRQWTALRPLQPVGNGVAIGIAVRERQLLAATGHFDGAHSSVRFWLGAAQ
ncbi:MAG: hypothetical protein M3406_14060 [Chloroflexota bacterium]|nr:hypothetical protein [Chloroflexota bacterium]